MSKYPKVNYIGNKEKVVDWIIDNLPINQGTILDLFCGGCSVSYALKKYGYVVYSNDILYSNYALAKALIENDNELLQLPEKICVPQNLVDEKYYEINWLVNNLFYDYEVYDLAKLIVFANNLNDYSYLIFISLLRRAFIRKLPYSRMNIKWKKIQELRDEDLSYKKYGRRRAYHNQSFEFHVRDNLCDYNDSVFSNGQKHKVFNLDCLDLINNLKPDEVDLIYIDPPYPSTMNDYSAFYGKFDQVFNKEVIEYTDFTNKTNFLVNMRKIILSAKSKVKFIVFSLNNNCNPSAKDILDSNKDLIVDYSILERDHMYKVTGKDKKRGNIELLLIVEI